ncbi:PAS domain S-box protein [Salinibacter ruber]|uniref:sensor histidine kinase n=1 Tax=Salinibacter ruber TaxID=146919 RepID=UPI0021673522|nr:PAS domain S-box protein [Salinibacter ruber]MCS3698653.1 PAS domain S-box-containing protein [Salinibacter ruber]
MVPSQLLSSDLFFFSYLAVFAAAALACLAGAWRAHKVYGKGVRRGLVALLGTSGLWALCHAGMLLSPGLGLKTALYEVGLVVGFATVFAWLWLCSSYSGRALHRRAGVRWAALAVFVAVTLTKLTNPWHGLYFSAELSAVPFRHLEVDHHVIYWLTAALSYAGAAVGFFMLCEPLRRARVGSGRLAGLFGLTALPLGANAIGYAGPYLLDLSHEPIGVAAFAIGVLFVYQDQFEATSQVGVQEKPTLILSEEDRIRNYNGPAAALFPALEDEEAVGQDVADLLPEVAEAVAGGAEPLQVEEEGAARYYRPAESTFGRGSGRRVILTDVTERTLRRRVQEQEHRFLAEAVGQAREAVLVTEAGPLDEPGPQIVYANEAFEEMTGYREAEVLGTTPRILQGPETERAVLDSLRAALEAGDEWEGETVNYRKDGTPYRVHWNISPVRGAGGQIEHWISVQRDVTEQREREKRLRRQKNLLAQTQQLAGAWEADPRTGEVSWSEKVYEIHEMDPSAEVDLEEGLGFYAPESRGRAEEATQALVEEGEPYDAELQIDTAEGNRRWVRTVGAPAETDDGEVTKVAGAFQDITDRKEAERELRRSQERLQMATEAGNVGTWNWDLETDRVVFNDQWAEMLGYSREELDFQFSTWEALVHPEDLPRALQMLETYLQMLETYIEGDAGTYDPEIRMRTKSGGWKWIQTIGRVVERDEEGAVTRVAGIHLDIDERKRAEQALREQEERLRGIANSLPGVVFQTGPQTDGPRRIRFVGEAAEEILGLRADPDGFRERLLERIPEPHRDELLRSLDEATEAEHPWRFEMPFDRPDGERIWILGTSTPTWKDGELVYNGVLLDITERKQAERALQQSRQRYWSLFKNSNDAILVHDLEGRIREANPQAEALFGREAGELEGLSIYGLHASGESETAQEKLQALRAGESYQAVARYERAGGPTFWGEVSASVTEIGGRAVARTLIRDVTERVRSRKKLEHYREYTDRLLDAIDDLFLVFDEEARLTRWNDRVAAVTGYADEALRGMEALSFVPEEERERVASQIADGFMTGHAQMEIPLLREDGTTVPYEIVGNLVEHPEDGLRVVAVGRDISERKERGRQLAVTSQRLEAILKHTTRPMFVKSRAGEYLLTNRRFREVFGFEEGEALGQTDRDLFPPEMAQPIEETDQTVLRGGTSVEREEQIQVDGEWHTYLSAKSPLYDVGTEQDPDRPVALFGVATDITERKRRERRLRQSETLFQNAQDALFLIDVESGGADRGEGRREFSIRRVNPAYEAATGFSVEDLYGRPLQDIFGEEAGRGIEERYRRCVRRQKPIEYEEELPVGGEVTYWQTRIAPVMVEGEVRQIVGTTRNISDRKRRKQRLERQNDLFERAQEIASVGAWEYDAQSDEVLRTREARCLYGKPPDEDLTVEEGMSCYHPGDRAAFREAIAEAKKGTPFDLELRLQVGPEETKWVRIRGEPLQEENPEGEVARIRGTIQDITERKEREGALRAAKEEAEEARREAEKAKEEAEEAKEEAQEASRLKSALLANMSHEIRTPLTSIIGFAEMLGREASGLELPEDSPLPGYASTIERSGKRLLETLNGVLNLSKLQAGQMEMESGPVDLSEQARLAAEELRPEAEEKGIGLELETGGGPAATAKADEGGVQIVLRNLLSNAIKYTEEGGVTVRTYQDTCQNGNGQNENGQSENGQSENGHAAVLEVEDTGIGMDPEVAGRLFEPFRQASEGISREYEGTGIGLAVTREATSQMGGSVEVDTQKGVGTCMTVRLPLAGEAETA